MTMSIQYIRDVLDNLDINQNHLIPRLLKEETAVLSIIFNRSLRQGCFSSPYKQCKDGYIAPIHK